MPPTDVPIIMDVSKYIDLNTDYVIYRTRKHYELRPIKIKIRITKITKCYIFYDFRLFMNSRFGEAPVFKRPENYTRNIKNQWKSGKSKMKFDTNHQGQCMYFTVNTKYLDDWRFENFKVWIYKNQYDGLRTDIIKKLYHGTHSYYLDIIRATNTQLNYLTKEVTANDIKRYMKNLRKRIKAKKTIVKYWCRARYNPEYKIGRKYAMDNWYQDIIGIPPPPNKPLPPIPNN